MLSIQMKTIDKKQALANMRLFATALLLLVTALYIVARSRHGHYVWDWVAAFAEAAMIGALADWFAVVALFKHPLGLPIPHTAIIPRNKERIADNLAAFVRDKFLDTEVLVEKVREFNPTLKIAAWLTHSDNAALLADKLVTVFVGALDFIDDLRVRQLLRGAVAQRLQQLDLGVLAIGGPGLLLGPGELGLQARDQHVGLGEPLGGRDPGLRLGHLEKHPVCAAELEQPCTARMAPLQ